MENVKVELDPTNKWPHLTSAELSAAGGLVWQWGLDALAQDAIKLQDFMEQAYGFGTLYKLDMGVQEDYVLTYPEDPDLHPVYIQAADKGDRKVVMYQYGIVLLEEDGTQFVTRMD